MNKFFFSNKTIVIEISIFINISVIVDIRYTPDGLLVLKKKIASITKTKFFDFIKLIDSWFMQRILKKKKIPDTVFQPPGVIKQISKLKNFINYSDSSILCFRSSNRKLN